MKKLLLTIFSLVLVFGSYSFAYADGNTVTVEGYTYVLDADGCTPKTGFPAEEALSPSYYLCLKTVGNYSGVSTLYDLYKVEDHTILVSSYNSFVTNYVLATLETFGIDSVPSSLLSVFYDWSVIVGSSLVLILGLLAALLGLYWGISAFARHITAGDLPKSTGFFADGKAHRIGKGEAYYFDR